MALADQARAQSDRRLRSALKGDPAKLAKILAERLTPILVEQGITSDQLGRITKITAGDYQMLTKDAEGVAQIHDLERAGIVISPQWDEGPEWPVVQPADPVRITPSKRKPPKRPGSVKRFAFLPDSQVGYRLRDNGTLDPTHDVKAQGVAIQLLEAIKPDGVIDLGDLCDFPEWSAKFLQAPEFALTTNATLTTAYRFLACQVASSPLAKHWAIGGNHDGRLAIAILKNAAAALRIRPADSPDHWPVLSMQNLLRTDELGITYVDGYPAGQVLLADNLVARHGFDVNSSGSTAAKVVNKSQVCTMFGHIHRMEFHPRWVTNADGSQRRIWAASPGTLARIDGAVPSYGSAENAHGDVVKHHENWNQAIAIVDVIDGAVQVPEFIEIDDGRAIWRDKEYVSDGDVPWRLDTLADVGRQG